MERQVWLVVSTDFYGTTVRSAHTSFKGARVALKAYALMNDLAPVNGSVSYEKRCKNRTETAQIIVKQLLKWGE